MAYKRPKKFERLSKEEKTGLMFDLVSAFRIVKKPVETALFMQDLLTANEIRNLAIRLRIAKLLLSGNTHREIQDELHTSLTTITKVRSWLEKGGKGLVYVIEKLPLKWEIPQRFPRGPIEYHLPQALLAVAEHSLAKSQDKKIEEFVREVKKKRNLDESLKKHSNEYYRERVLRVKSEETKKKFQRKLSSKR